MKTKKRDAIVSFKTCPRCQGAGKVPCDGLEYHRELHRQWAQSFHLKPVVYNWLGKAALPGLAVAQVMPGGWWGLKVYVAVTAIPRSGIYGVYGLDERGVPKSIMNIQGVDLNYFDIINDKAFWCLAGQWFRKNEITLLDYWPEAIDEIRRIAEGGIKLLEEAK